MDALERKTIVWVRDFLAVPWVGRNEKDKREIEREGVNLDPFGTVAILGARPSSCTVFDTEQVQYLNGVYYTYDLLLVEVAVQKW